MSTLSPSSVARSSQPRPDSSHVAGSTTHDHVSEATATDARANEAESLPTNANVKADTIADVDLNAAFNGIFAAGSAGAAVAPPSSDVTAFFEEAVGTDPEDFTRSLSRILATRDKAHPVRKARELIPRLPTKCLAWW